MSPRAPSSRISARRPYGPAAILNAKSTVPSCPCSKVDPALAVLVRLQLTGIHDPYYSGTGVQLYTAQWLSSGRKTFG